MRKSKFIMLCFLFITLGMSTVSASQNNWDRAGLKGKVKSFLEIYYKPQTVFGKIEPGNVLDKGHYRTNFNNKGFIEDLIFLDKYDKNISSLEFIYDKDKLIKQNSYDHGDLIISMKVKDINNKKFECLEYDEDDNLKSRKIYILDDNNQIVKNTFSVFLDDGSTTQEFITDFKFDDNNNMIEMTQNAAGNSTTLKFKYVKYDDKGNWIMGLIFSGSDTQPEKVTVRRLDYY